MSAHSFLRALRARLSSLPPLAGLAGLAAPAGPALIGLSLAASSLGCGRSTLDDYLVGDASVADTSSDVAMLPDIGVTTCDPGKCASGCCDSQGVCQTGTASDACGGGGQTCANCLQTGATCAGQVCVTPPPACGPQNCKGCCVGDSCQGGTSQGACGLGGKACANCAQLGEGCSVTGLCVGSPTCNPGNCAGCCAGNTCLAGNMDTACGFKGQQCAACSATGETCQNQTCVAPSTCDAKTCPLGCCAGNKCMAGTSDVQCGAGGLQCQDCAASKGQCQKQTCVGTGTCNPGNCSGCCDVSGRCQAGFLDTQCGGNGATCQDCATETPPGTCNGAVTPPVCTSKTALCPAPYPGCPASLMTPPLPTQLACSATDLQNAAAACAGGNTTTACVDFFRVEKANNPRCFSCLTPFDFDYYGARDPQGIIQCVAAFVSPTCNHSASCYSACEDDSCASCPAGSDATCRQSVATGQCGSYAQPASCVITALLNGPGAFCSPQRYANFGAWLAGVGKTYCDQ